MWSTLSKKLSISNINKLIDAAKYFEEINEKRHFINDGKKFFHNTYNRSILIEIIKEINLSFRFNKIFKYPTLHHSYLLYKSPGGNETEIHKDITYWKNIKNSDSMITFWISLEHINKNKGALKLNKNNYIHSKDFAINSGINTFSKSKLVPIETEKSEVLIFDANEYHASTKNTTKSCRKAFKFVMGDDLDVDNPFMERFNF